MLLRGALQAAVLAVASAAAVRTLRGQSGQGGQRADLNQVLQPEILRGTGLQWLQDEEGSLRSTDLSVKFEKGRPSELEAILVLKSPDEWERFMRFMRRYALTNDLSFERSPAGDG